MRRGKRGILFALLMSCMMAHASAQLRNFSEYNQDRINIDKTYFVLHDSGDAEYTWTSEWTHSTAYAADGKSAILVWHFKDGKKAYSQQGEGIGEFGKTTGYLISDTSGDLQDVNGNRIQPLSLDNYPVKIELWIGEVEAAAGYKPEAKGDEACFEEPVIAYNNSYHFSYCRGEESRTMQ